MATGSIRWFSSDRGFGFIAPDMGPRDVFLHAIIVAEAGMETPAPGDRVEFDLVQQRDGRLSALNLRRLSDTIRVTSVRLVSALTTRQNTLARRSRERAAMNEVDFASLLCSRLCHDMLSPVGALNNGIELLADETDPEMRAALPRAARRKRAGHRPTSSNSSGSLSARPAASAT